jgi:2-polyprenyl-6-methoxyphenol hydroxylase-like FAD-dependent oxidoreductase
MKALIIGAGVCGPVAGLAFRRAGIEAAVFDARPAAAADVGSYLTIAENGIDALRSVDAHRPVLAAGFPTTRNVLFSGTGRRLGAVPIASGRGGRDASHTLKRARLHRALHEEAARRGVAVEFGKRLVSAQAASGGVVAQFEDGSRAAGDLLVGCDGIHSVTRRIIDPRAPAPRYLGLLNFGGITPGSVGEEGAWHMIFGARAFFGYVPDAAGRTVWFANVPRHESTRDEREATTMERWKQYLIGLFAGDRGPASDLIAAGTLELAADNTHDLPRVPVWHRPRTPLIVIGDAAHAPSPSSGQGASIAIEDAVVLAQCLRDGGSIEDAFGTFERVRRGRVERIVAQGARSSSSKAAGRVGRIVRDMMLPFVFRHVVTEKSLAWMYDHHVDWERPVA